MSEKKINWMKIFLKFKQMETDEQKKIFIKAMLRNEDFQDEIASYLLEVIKETKFN